MSCYTKMIHYKSYQNYTKMGKEHAEERISLTKEKKMVCEEREKKIHPKEIVTGWAGNIKIFGFFSVVWLNGL